MNVEQKSGNQIEKEKTIQSEVLDTSSKFVNGTCRKYVFGKRADDEATITVTDRNMENMKDKIFHQIQKYTTMNYVEMNELADWVKNATRQTVSVGEFRDHLRIKLNSYKRQVRKEDGKDAGSLVNANKVVSSVREHPKTSVMFHSDNLEVLVEALLKSLSGEDPNKMGEFFFCSIQEEKVKEKKLK